MVTSVPKRWLLPLLVAAVSVVCAVPAAGALASAARVHSRVAHGGPLTGTWKGTIVGGESKPLHIVIVVNAKESGGSWSVNRSCHGPLVLDSISGGYHHYRRELAHGATCAGGDVDCLKRAGASMYDAVTSHLGGAWDSSGTLRRVKRG